MTDDSISPTGVHEAPKKRVLRPEIQALRAIAVATVVIFHYWPRLISGGYIGVDVFFAISGFLITGHLVREVEGSGRVSLAGFWARRARRILPAALLVLLFCAVATFLIVPLNLWHQFFREIQASTLYVENWYLAHQAVDYLGADNRPSPVQHYWSLSVEEQFYIVWPLLILIAMAVARNGSALLRRRAIILILALLTAASLAYSIWDTAENPASAFFVTPTRVWEFGAGGLLAIFAVSTARPQLRAAVSWIGVAMILVAAFAYTPETRFPGTAAILPIVGTLAVIWAGSPALRWAPTGWMSLRPTQWLGDVSYSVYLWHWPLLILTPFLLVAELGTPIKLALVGLTLVLAALSKRFVEDPLRSGPLLANRKPRRSFVFALAGTGAVLLATVAALAVLSARQDDDTKLGQQLLAAHTRCLGAAARDPEHQPCNNPRLRLLVTPSPAAAVAGIKTEGEVCSADQIVFEGALAICSFGVPADRAKRHVALVGDSHSFKWRTGFYVAALKRGWNVTSIGQTGCPFSLVAPPTSTGEALSTCQARNRQLPSWLERHPEIDTVFFAQASQFIRPKKVQSAIKGYEDAWRTLPKSVKTIIILRDNPKALKTTLDCIERAIGDHQPAGTACAIPRARVIGRFTDAAPEAARRLNKPNVGVIDLTDFYCDEKLCYPVIGGVLVTSDKSHLTPLFNTTLVPFLLRALDRGGWLKR